MKILPLNIIYLTMIMFCWSCSKSELFVKSYNKKANINTNHWVTYKEAKKSKKLLTSLENIQITTKPILNNISINTNPDSVKIITNRGAEYLGTIVKSDFSGYFIKINNNREIYISNQEIKKITFIDKIKSEIISTDSTQIIQNTELEIHNEDDFYNNEITGIQNQETIQEVKKTEPMSLLSFIFGILGFVPLPVIGGLGWIAALILSKAGRKKIDKNPEKYKGRGFAVAGQVLGLIGITLALLALGLVVLFLILFF